MSFTQSYPYPYPGGAYPGYPQAQPMPDQLAMLRQQQYQPQQMPQVPQMMPQPDNGIIWVQGEAGAKAYPVAPGASVVLWDSENPHLYIKSAAFNGIPSMEILRREKYTPAPPAPQQSYQQGEYASMEAVRELDSKISALSARIDHLTREGNQTQEDM